MYEITDKMERLASAFRAYKDGNGEQPDLTDAVISLTASVHSLAHYVERFKTATIGDRHV